VITKNTTILCSVCVLATLATTLIGTRLMARAPQPKFAVVDLAAVVRKHQEKAVALLADGAADQTLKRTALSSASEFGRRLDREVVDMSKECGCVLLMREAVVSGQIEDLTPQLLVRLATR
jgi:hypothetical protein